MRGSGTLTSTNEAETDKGGFLSGFMVPVINGTQTMKPPQGNGGIPVEKHRILSLPPPSRVSFNEQT